MRELALFSGAGGGILGGYLLGWETVCAVEIDDYARRVLLARQRDGILPAFPIWDDIRTFDGRPWRGRCDIVTGGFPCTDISVAGKGAGITGKQSGLWSEMSRVVCEVRPRFAFVENVPALTSRGLGRVLGDLADLGYDARWCVLGADDAGAPHHRKRIWILAYPMRERRPTESKSGEQKYSADLNRNGEKSDVPDPSRTFRRESNTPGYSSEILANAPDNGTGRREQQQESSKSKEYVANASGAGLQKPTQRSIRSIREKKRKPTGSESCGGNAEARTYWTIEPDVGRVAHELSHKMDIFRKLTKGIF